MNGLTIDNKILEDEILNSGFFYVFKSFAWNYYLYYILWLVSYLFVIFIARQRVIKERNYMTLYRYSIESHLVKKY